MSAIGDKIKRWCREESLSLVAQQDDEDGLAYVVTLPGEAPLSVRVNGSGPKPSQILLEHTFEIAVPEQVAAQPQGPRRIATLLQRVAATRSGLVRCRQTGHGARTAAEVVVALHQDGTTKHGFLTALEEVRKVGSIITWELEGMSATAGMLSEIRAIVEGAAAAVGGAGAATGAPPAEAAAPAAEPRPAAPGEGAPSAAEPGPAPSPAPTAEAAPTPAVPFCPGCGRQARPEHRFCIGCGTPLKG